MTKSKLLQIIIIAALTGLTIFGVMIWRATEVEDSSEADALWRFAEIRSRFDSPAPIFRLGSEPTRVANTIANGLQTQEPDALLVLVYHKRSGRLASTRIPFWFYELKAPAVEFTLRGAGFDPDALGLTLEDMQGHGLAVLLDEELDNGDLILVWTE